VIDGQWAVIRMGMVGVASVPQEPVIAEVVVLAS